MSLARQKSLGERDKGRRRGVARWGGVAQGEGAGFRQPRAACRSAWRHGWIGSSAYQSTEDSVVVAVQCIHILKLIAHRIRLKGRV